MLRNLLAALAVVIILSTFHPANAALVDNGKGLIYDTDLNITWYDNPNYNTGMLDYYVTWVNGLVVEGVSGWRLPTTPGTGTGYINEGELGHLFYSELGNSAGALTNKGPFSNLTQAWLGFYTSTNVPGTGHLYYYFDLGSGNQAVADINNWYFWIHGIAVHDGNISPTVPVPSAFLLLGAGLIGLSGLKRRIAMN